MYEGMNFHFKSMKKREQKPNHGKHHGILIVCDNPATFNHLHIFYGQFPQELIFTRGVNDTSSGISKKSRREKI